MEYIIPRIEHFLLNTSNSCGHICCFLSKPWLNHFSHDIFKLSPCLCYEVSARFQCPTSDICSAAHYQGMGAFNVWFLLWLKVSVVLSAWPWLTASWTYSHIIFSIISCFDAGNTCDVRENLLIWKNDPYYGQDTPPIRETTSYTEHYLKQDLTSYISSHLPIKRVHTCSRR